MAYLFIDCLADDFGGVWFGRAVDIGFDELWTNLKSFTVQANSMHTYVRMYVVCKGSQLTLFGPKEVDGPLRSTDYVLWRTFTKLLMSLRHYLKHDCITITNETVPSKHFFRTHIRTYMRRSPIHSVNAWGCEKARRSLILGIRGITAPPQHKTHKTQKTLKTLKTG